MIWNGYTGAAGWMLRQSCEGVIGATLVNNRVVLPADMALARGDLKVIRLQRELAASPFRER
jgi:cyclic beta-1,2-glucan synthetase